MRAPWPIVPLGDLVRLDLDRVPIDASKAYPMVGVLSFGRGLFDRETIENGSTSYRHFYRLKSDHIVMSQLFGWEGALALSNKRFAGKYLSPQFPTFLSDDARLDRHYLGWLMRRPSFWLDLATRASGMGDRRRTLNPDAFFACRIALPSLGEQRSIVARIEDLVGKIEEARNLRDESERALDAFVASTHMALASAKVEALSTFLELYEDAVPIEVGMPYPQVGVRGFGGGLFPKTAVDGGQTTYRAFNRLYSGALVMSQVKGWEGAVAMAPKKLEGYFVSPEYRTFRCREDRCLPEYLAALVPTEFFWGRLKDATRGVGARRERTRPEQFLQLEFSMPSLGDQKRAVSLFKSVYAVQALQQETAAELDALVPAILDKAFKGEL